MTEVGVRDDHSGCSPTESEQSGQSRDEDSSRSHLQRRRLKVIRSIQGGLTGAVGDEAGG